MDIPDHWRLIMDGFPDAGKGDVFTRDGEVLGRWGIAQGVFYTFASDDGALHLYEPFLGVLVDKVIEWHEARQAGPV